MPTLIFYEDPVAARACGSPHPPKSGALKGPPVDLQGSTPILGEPEK